MFIYIDDDDELDLIPKKTSNKRKSSSYPLQKRETIITLRDEKVVGIIEYNPNTGKKRIIKRGQKRKNPLKNLKALTTQHTRE